MNLMRNAIAHHDIDRGVVAITAWCDDAQFICVVADDGPGIDPSWRDRIFLPFESFSGGSGLGLALCQKSAQAHGASVTLTSQCARERGSAFEIRWPMTAPPAAPERDRW